MMNYKLRISPVDTNINSFKFEITETPALSSETIPPGGNVGKRWAQAPAYRGGLQPSGPLEGQHEEE